MGDQNQGDSSNNHFSGRGAVHIRGPLSESERKAAESEQRSDEQRKRDDSYKQRQLELDDGQLQIAKKQLRTNSALVWITACTAILGMIGNGITYISADAARRAADIAEATLKETKTSSAQASLNAAQDRADNAKALDATIEQSRSDQRAWVGLLDSAPPAFSDGGRNVFVKLGERGPIGVYITNTGRSPALRVEVRYAARFLPIENAFTPLYTPPPGGFPKETASVLFPGARWLLAVDFPFGEGERATPALIRSLTTQSMQAIRLYVYGEIKYFDVFGKRHSTKLCAYLTRDLTRFDSCDTYNEAD